MGAPSALYQEVNALANKLTREELRELRPRSCKLCYWGTERGGCTLDACYYEQPIADKPPSECDGCPYRRDQPCIGWCTRKIMREMGLLPARKEEGTWNLKS